MKKVHSILLGLCVIGLITIVCSDNKTTTPATDSGQALAGGGRLEDDDPSTGREDTTDYTMPEPWPYPGLMTLFYSDINCFDQPVQRVIRDSAEWRQWRDSAWACLPVYSDSIWYPSDSSGMDSLGGDSMMINPVDSGTVPPDSAYGWIPYVDFDSNVVIVIALEEETSFGRMLWIDEITAESQIHYSVTKLGDDCISMLMRPELFTPTSPTIAVMAPRPLDEPVEWVRHDTVWNCSWEPDPNMPITVYYTDSPCDLGLNEQLITDEDTYRQWVDKAIACDSARWWGILIDSGYGCGFGVSGGYSFSVDFSTHAVIILRAGSQTHWGGGVWLNGYDNSGENTVIDYSVMEPADDCPPIEELAEINPTVAIQVLKPIGSTVTWNRHTETIECSWTDTLYIDSTWGGR